MDAHWSKRGGRRIRAKRICTTARMRAQHRCGLHPPAPPALMRTTPEPRVILYRLLLSLALPVLLVRLVWRTLRGAEPRAMLAERLGGGAPGAPGALWLHAASNGELASAQPLIAALLAARPDLQLLVTSNTATAQTLARSWNEPRLTARAAPLDARWILARFLARHRPAALIVVENELWPNRMTLAAARGLPVFVVGARISARSAQRWRRSGLGPRLMAAITALSAQDPASEAGFLSLGLRPDAVLAQLNLKTAVAAPAPDYVLDWPRAATVLAASTHEGEEAVVLDALVQARALRPGLRLILAPRHPRRAPEIAALITARGLAHVSRSSGAAPQAEVLLADTMGEMANWYAAAGLCFIGGTLVEKGGHTPWEPAAYGCALVHGPSISNHAAAFAALARSAAAWPVHDSATLAAAFARPANDWADIGARARKALAALREGSGTARLADQILERLP